MNWWHAAILGLVEGITEYLPISSTGHLVIASGLLGLQDTDNEARREAVKSFEIVIQGGAILAVLSLYWPRFVQNQVERYEARFVSLKIESSPSVLFRGMEGSVLPIAVAHGEGYTEFPDKAAAAAFSRSGLVAARYVDNHHEVTEQYPLNPNGSPFGMTALTTTTGRVTIMMPHPERVFRSACMSWAPKHWPEDSPWMKLFINARSWVG